MFSGIGGFRLGLERIGGYKCVGHCEIDKHANKSYNAVFNTEGEYYHDDARTINAADLPDFDLLCGGFPCQAFSVAGARKGFDDTRGSLFFEIARVVESKRPKYLLLENVPGLLAHDKGKTYKTILSTLYELGYHVEWQVLNSKDIGHPRPVPHNRRRLFIVGYLDTRCAGEILPIIGKSANTLKQIVGGGQGYSVYDPSGVSVTLMSGVGGMRAKCGLYFIDLTRDKPAITENARCLLKNYNKGTNKRKAESSGVLESIAPIPIMTSDFLKKRQNRKRYKSPNAPMYTLTAKDRHGLMLNGRIRKLTPQECLRLQGFEDEQIDKILAITSDNQAYIQAGNAVTANVIAVLGSKIKTIDKQLRVEV
jgi:DNA (cytosine-5)-methyltransferase 1